VGRRWGWIFSVGARPSFGAARPRARSSSCQPSCCAARTIHSLVTPDRHLRPSTTRRGASAPLPRASSTPWWGSPPSALLYLCASTLRCSSAPRHFLVCIPSTYLFKYQYSIPNTRVPLPHPTRPLPAHLALSSHTYRIRSTQHPPHCTTTTTHSCIYILHFSSWLFVRRCTRRELHHHHPEGGASVRTYSSLSLFIEMYEMRTRIKDTSNPKSVRD
jgi:hypothetical protein